MGRVLSIYLYSIAYSIANSVGYFIHSALGDVLTKLPKAYFSKIFSDFFFETRSPKRVGGTQKASRESPHATGLLLKPGFVSRDQRKDAVPAHTEGLVAVGIGHL